MIGLAIPRGSRGLLFYVRRSLSCSASRVSRAISISAAQNITNAFDGHSLLPSCSVFKPYASIGTNLLFFEKGTPTKEIWFWEHRVPEGQKAYSMTKPIRFEHFRGCIDWWGGAKREGREETPQAWRVTAEEVKARGYNLDIKNPHRWPTTRATQRRCWPTWPAPRPTRRACAIS